MKSNRPSAFHAVKKIKQKKKKIWWKNMISNEGGQSGILHQNLCRKNVDLGNTVDGSIALINQSKFQKKL